MRLSRVLLAAAKKINPGPLWGLKVLDLSRIVAGPYCTMILSDMGAQVIKVERVGNVGDETRLWGEPLGEANSSISSYFLALNRNKLSVCVDFTQPEGAKLLLDLVQQCHVLVENFVPGTLDKYGLDYDSVRVVAPHLVYCSITGYGPRGPYASKPGYDVIAASMGGLLHCTGLRGSSEPVKPGVAVTDMMTGLYAHGAILAALMQQRGQKIDCDLFSTQLAALINVGSTYLNGSTLDQSSSAKWGTAHESIVPYEAFRVKDGYLTVGAGSDVQFRDLCRRLGCEYLSDMDAYRTNRERVRNRDQLIEHLQNIFEGKTKAQWMQIFEGCKFPCGPVNTLREVFEDNHVKELGLVENLEHPVIGRMRVVGPPVQFGDGGNFVRAPPPLLGQHTDQIMHEMLHLSDDRIASLRKQNIIQ